MSGALLFKKLLAGMYRKILTVVICVSFFFFFKKKLWIKIMAKTAFTFAPSWQFSVFCFLFLFKGQVLQILSVFSFIGKKRLLDANYQSHVIVFF